MIQIILQTKAFKALPQFSKFMAIKRVNRVKIEEEIVIARNIGLEQWKKQTPLQANWQAIVEEIITKE